MRAVFLESAKCNARPLLVAMLVNACCHSLFFISFPPLARQLGLSDLQSGLILTVSASCMMLAAPCWGVWGERIGRRPLIITGLSAVALFTGLNALLFYLTVPLGWTPLMLLVLLMISRLLQAVLAAGLMPWAQAYLVDIMPLEQRMFALGRLAAAFGTGSMLAAALLWLFSGASVVFLLAAAAILCALNALWLWLYLPESPRVKASAQRVIDLAPIWPCLLITFCGLLCYGMVQQITALRLQDQFQLSLTQALKTTGALMMATMFVMVIAQSYLLPRLRISAIRLLYIASGFVAVALLTAGFAVQLWLFYVAMLLLGLGLGVLLPANLMLLTLVCGQSGQAKAAGINAFAQGLGLATGPLLAALLYRQQIYGPYVLASLMLILAALIIFWRRSSFDNSCSVDDSAELPTDLA